MSRCAQQVVVLVPLFLLALSPAGAAPPTEEEIAKLIQQLGDDSFATREKATQQLWEAGKAAEPALRKAQDSSDAEVARRARELLDKFKWGIYPDTPKEVLERISRYQTGNATTKMAAVRELFELGGPGVTALMKISIAEEEPNLRKQLSQMLTAEAARAIPGMLADGNFATLDEIFEVNLAAGTEPALLHYAAYWLFREKIDDKIAHFKAQVEKKDGTRAAEVLFYLCRVKGDPKTTLWAARRSEKPDLVEMALYDQADWKALAELDGLSSPDQVEALSFRLAFNRLAGNKDKADKLAGELRKLAQDVPDDRNVFNIAEALFLNGRYNEGMDLFNRRRDVSGALEVLCTQSRFREASEAADRHRNDPNKDAITLEMVRARALYALGEKEQAVKILNGLSVQLQQVGNMGLLESLVMHEHRMGLKDIAFEHCANALVRLANSRGQTRLFNLLFGDRTEYAESWWKFLRRRYPQEAPATAMKKVRDLMEGKLAEKDLEALVRETEQLVPPPDPNFPVMPGGPMTADDQEKVLVAAGEALLVAGKDDQAKAFWEKAAGQAKTPWPALRLGDHFADRKQWKEAVEQYLKACEKNRKEPLPLFLRGWAMTQAGHKPEGRKLMDLAHVLPLGDDTIRSQFAAALSRRGHKEEALKEHELVLRLVRPTLYGGGDAQRLLATDAVQRKDYFKAADHYERAMLRILKTTTYYLDAGSYVSVPTLIHRCRAMGHLGAGKLEEARKEIELGMTAMPAGIDLPIYVVPELEKGGHKKEAEDLFARVYTFHEKSCADNPKSAVAHNSLAWLAARCRRQLDKAVEHAQKAVDLAPDVPGYHESLAEAHFQKGDKTKAVEAIKKAIELEPKRTYYRNQLKRIEAGDPTAPLPDPAG